DESCSAPLKSSGVSIHDFGRRLASAGQGAAHHSNRESHERREAVLLEQRFYEALRKRPEQHRGRAERESRSESVGRVPPRPYTSLKREGCRGKKQHHSDQAGSQPQVEIDVMRDVRAEPPLGARIVELIRRAQSVTE